MVSIVELRSVFGKALEITAPEERAAFLSEACGDNAELRAQVEKLLEALTNAGPFMGSPALSSETLTSPSESVNSHSPIGPYNLLQKLGEGGMGTVYLAEQLQPVQRRVAVKVIKPGMDSGQIIARFEQERQALAMMDHPNIAKVLDAGATGNGRPYFVMELVNGVPITRYCDQERLSLKDRLELFIPVCQAVQHAHQKGIIHRDLKPSNVLITNYDGRPVPKVIDFGLAKATGSQLSGHTLLTEAGMLVGTLEYMAPEQAEQNNLDIDTRADVYSLGIMLYELLTGSPPFSSKQLREHGFAEMLRVIKEVEPPKPSSKLLSSAELPSIAATRRLVPKSLTKTVTGELDWIVMKCLEKERGQRYETANGLARDIQRFLSEEVVEAGPPSARYRLRKFARKHRKLLWIGGAFAFLLVAGAAISTWQAVRATLAEHATAEERDKVVKEKERADEEAAIAQAVNDFLNDDLLLQAEPSSSPDRDLKLRAVLDRASTRIEGRFADRPLVEARIRLTLGKTYRGLGEHATAERHCSRARELYLQVLGPDHRATLTATNDLAGVYFYQGRLKDARPLVEAVIESQRHVLGPEHRDTLRSMTSLGNLQYSLGNLQEAEDIHVKTLELQRSAFGAKHLDTLYSMNDLARVLRALGKLNEARKLNEHALVLIRETVSPEHPLAIACSTNLANVLQMQGQFEAALRLHEDILQINRRVFGAEHHFTLSAKHNVARSLVRVGRGAEARQHFEEAYEGHRRIMGPSHSETLNILRGLIWLLCTAKDDAVRDPKRAYEMALELVKQEAGKDRSSVSLGVAAYRVGEWKTAITELERVVFLADGRNSVTANLFLSMAYAQSGEKDKARQAYDKALQWMTDHQPADEELQQFRSEAAKTLGLSQE